MCTQTQNTQNKTLRWLILSAQLFKWRFCNPWQCQLCVCVCVGVHVGVSACVWGGLCMCVIKWVKLTVALMHMGSWAAGSVIISFLINYEGRQEDKVWLMNFHACTSAQRHTHNNRLWRLWRTCTKRQPPGMSEQDKYRWTNALLYA